MGYILGRWITDLYYCISIGITNENRKSSRITIYEYTIQHKYLKYIPESLDISGTFLRDVLSTFYCTDTYTTHVLKNI